MSVSRFWPSALLVAGSLSGTVKADEKRRQILDAAARYRDDVSSITSIADWKAMADAMGLANMGGPAPVTPGGQR